MSDKRLIVHKTIYAKRKGMTSEEIGEVFRVEAEYHLRKNPDLDFLKIGKPSENADRSKTYPMYFAVKPPVQ